jgi:hypothetical protein
MMHIVLYFRAANKVNSLSGTGHLTSHRRPIVLNLADLKAVDRIIGMKSTGVQNQEQLCQLEDRQQNYASVPGIQNAS